jgi:hypothetical protein
MSDIDNLLQMMCRSETKYGAVRMEVPPAVMQSCVDKMAAGTGEELTTQEALMRGYVLMFCAINKRPFDSKRDMPKSLVGVGDGKRVMFEADGVRLPFNEKLIDAYVKGVRAGR